MWLLIIIAMLVLYYANLFPDQAKWSISKIWDGTAIDFFNLCFALVVIYGCVNALMHTHYLALQRIYWWALIYNILFWGTHFFVRPFSEKFNKFYLVIHPILIVTGFLGAVYWMFQMMMITDGSGFFELWYNVQPQFASTDNPDSFRSLGSANVVSDQIISYSIIPSFMMLGICYIFGLSNTSNSKKVKSEQRSADDSNEINDTLRADLLRLHYRKVNATCAPEERVSDKDLEEFIKIHLPNA